jgi:hypothetical protein
VTLTVNAAPCVTDPAIEQQPKNATVTEPAAATFSAAGSTPDHCAAPSVQWYSEAPGAGSFSAISGATSPSYKTPGTTTAESGTKFEAVFKNAAGETTSDEVTLTVNAAPCVTDPAIEQQPKNATVTEPAAATFSAAGSTPDHCAAPSVQWYSEAPGAGSFSAISGATSPSYKTPGTTTAESGTKFEAVFKNAAGETTSDEVTLTVNPAPCSASPEVEEQPVSATVTEPAAATFSAAGTTPEHCSAPSVQWYSQAPGAGSFSAIGGATSPSYKTPATTTAESGTKFEAVFKNAAGETTSNEVTLTVNPPPCSASPEVEVQPKNATVTEPAAATFSAAGSTPPHCSAPSVQWYSEAPGAGGFSAIAGATSPSYKTPATTTAESGTKFEAVFKNAAGETASSAATLTVNPPPCVTDPAIEEQPKDETVTEPAAATFSAAGTTPEHCAAPSVQWYSKAPGGSSFSAISGATSPSYKTPATTTAESGTKFEAVFKNAAGETTSSAATLTVNPPPCVTDPAIEEQPVSATVTEPAAATFSAAGSTPEHCGAPSVQWYSKAPGAGSFSAISGATSPSYKTPATTTAESGTKFEAVFKNAAGETASNEATLTVNPAPCVTDPAIEEQPKAQTVTEPGAATFTVGEGPVPAHCSAAAIQWQVSTNGTTWSNVSGGNISGATSTTLSIDPTSTSESKNEYRAVLTNAAGSTKSSVATLTVKPPPPTVTSIEPSSGPTAGSTAVTIKGKDFLKGATVTIGSAATEVKVVSEGEIKAKTAPGSGTQQVVVTDEGGTSTLGPSYTYIPPPVVMLNQPVSPSKNTTPSFTGNASDTTPITVKIYAGATVKGSPVSTATATGTGGSWTSGDASPALEDGQYTATATQEGLVGNPAGVSPPVTFTVDTLPPTVTLAQPVARSRNTTPTFSGTGSEEGTEVQVRVLEGVKEVGKGQTTVGAGGAWSTGLEAPLPTGKHTFTVRATEKSGLGNQPGESEVRSFEVDTLAPAVTLESPPLVSGNSTPSFSGTASESEPVTIEVFKGAQPHGTPVATVVTQLKGGTYQTRVISPLESGQYTAIATEPSSIGDEKGASAPVTFEIETNAPTVVINKPPRESNETTQTFSGTVIAPESEKEKVEVLVHRGPSYEGPLLGTFDASVVKGQWKTAPVTLEAGTHTYTVVAATQSAIGNGIGKSAPATFLVNTEPPVVNLTQPQAVSNNIKPIFSGTGSEEDTEVQVHVLEGGKEVDTGHATVIGQNWSAALEQALPEGEHTYTVYASEKSGLKNHEGESKTYTFTVDTLVPVVKILTGPQETSANTTPKFSGTASESGPHSPVTITIYRGGSTQGSVAASIEATNVENGEWFADETDPLEWGEYTAVATQTSSVGNAPGTSSPMRFVVAKIPPTVSTEAAGELAESHAALYASVNPEGAPVHSCKFEYGPTSSYGKSIECGFVSGLREFPDEASGPVAVFVRIYGLRPSTTYHDRIVAVGEGGTATGADQTFTTRPEEEGEAAAPGATGAGSGSSPSSSQAQKAGTSGVAALFAAQLIPSGKAARIAALLRAGAYSQRFKAPEAGTAIIKWYFLKPGTKLGGKGKRAPVLVASGSVSFHAAGTTLLKIRLTSAGKQLLRSARRIRLTATSTFTPLGGTAVTTAGAFTLKR